MQTPSDGSATSPPDIPLPVPSAWLTARQPDIQLPPRRHLRAAARYDARFVEEVTRAARNGAPQPLAAGGAA